MNLLKNKWALIILGILVLGSIGLLFRKQLGPMFGGYTKSTRGYYYRFVEGHELEKVKGPGYHIIFQYILLGPNGDTIENKMVPSVQLQRDYPVEAKNEMEDLMQIASPGSLVEILVPTDTLRQRVNSNMKVVAMEAGKTAKFLVKIISVMDDNQFAAYENKRKIERYKKEFDEMDAYAAANKGEWVLDSATNIKYIVRNKTEIARLKFADRVEFNCEVYTLAGDLIVNSGMEGKKYKTLIGSNSFSLEGLETALTFLADNEEGLFLVTSDYGFKEKGYNNIVKPYAPLLIKIKDIKKIVE